MDRPIISIRSILRLRSRFLALHQKLHLVLCLLYIFLTRGVIASWTKDNHAYEALTLDKNSSLAHSKLQTLAQQTCSSKEYVSETLGCRQGWERIGRGCYIQIKENMKWSAAKARCLGLKSTLAKFDYKQDIYTYLEHQTRVMDWIGMYTDKPTRDKSKFKWLDGTKPKFDFWLSSQPDAYNEDNNVFLEKNGFHDKNGDGFNHYALCRHELPSGSADKDIEEKWKISSKPENIKEFVGGAKIKIICEGYYRPGQEPFIMVEKTKGPTTKIYFHEYIYAPKERSAMVKAFMESEVPKAMEERIQSRFIKGFNRFIKTNGKCIRQSMPNAVFTFGEPFAESRLKCCHRYNDAENDCSSNWLDTPKLRYLPRKPHIQIVPPQTGRGFWIGETVRCACTAVTGSDTVLSAAVITHANCFNWTVSVDGASKIMVKHGILKECDISVDMSTVRKTFKDLKGNNVSYEVTLTMSETLDGAVYACYSYNVSSRTNLTDLYDELQSVSEPFRIIYPPAKPILRVAYHALPNIVWRGEVLEASCSANLGNEGGDTMMEFFANNKTNPFDPRKVNDTIHLPGVGTLRIQSRIVSLECQLGWRGYADAGTCLWVSVEAFSWKEARQTCKYMNADLVVIRDSVANEFITGLLNADRFWIGISNHLRQTDNTNVTDYFSLGGPEKDPYANWNSNGYKPRTNTQDCVYIMEGEWGYTTCNSKFRFVCERASERNIPLALTAPPGEEGTLDDSVFVVINSGEVVMTKIAIEVNDSLEGASLGCRTFLQSPTYDFELKSEDLKVQYGPKAPFMSISLTEINGQKAVQMRCAASVGDGGFLSFAVVDGDTIRHLYIINTTYEVITEEPSADVTIDKITVITAKDKNPRIVVRVTMKLTDQIGKSRLYCDSRKLNMDSRIAQHKLSSLPDESSEGGVALALLALIAAATTTTLCLVLREKKKKSSNAEEDGATASAPFGFKSQEGETIDGEADKPHDEASELHDEPTSSGKSHEALSGEKSHEGGSHGEKPKANAPSVNDDDDA